MLFVPSVGAEKRANAQDNSDRTVLRLRFLPLLLSVRQKFEAYTAGAFSFCAKQRHRFADQLAEMRSAQIVKSFPRGLAHNQRVAACFCAAAQAMQPRSLAASAAISSRSSFESRDEHVVRRTLTAYQNTESAHRCADAWQRMYYS